WSNVNPDSRQAEDFVILNNGQKLFGKVVRAYDFSNYDQVDFQYQGNLKTYFPSDLQAFGLDNGRFFMSKMLPGSSVIEFVQVLFSGSLQLDFKKGKYYIDYGTDIQELKSYYQGVPGEGSPKKRHVKLYIATLKILTAGVCGQSLTDLIERSKLDEQDFIQILIQYHECEKLPYKLHVEKIPFVRVSPLVGLAAGLDVTNSSDILDNFNYSFSNSLSYGAFVGFRLHDFRRFAKSSLDFKVGYVMRKTILDASVERRVELNTASQEFKESNVVIPISYNYSFIKNSFADLYMGLVLTGRFSALQNNLSIVETTSSVSQDKTVLNEEEIMSVLDFSLMPGIKVGANFPTNSKMKIFTELGIDYMKNQYQVQILNLPEFNINRTFISFQVGVEF
ncbi:hypothetical protein, partial [Algoriphagus sp.]